MCVPEGVKISVYAEEREVMHRPKFEVGQGCMRKFAKRGRTFKKRDELLKRGRCSCKQRQG